MSRLPSPMFRKQHRFGHRAWFVPLLLTPLMGRAETREWNALDGTWQVATNWQDAVVPMSTDDVLFNRPGTSIAVGLAADAATRDLRLLDTRVKLSLNGQTLAVGGELWLDANSGATSSLAFPDGMLAVTGTTTVAAGATLALSGGTFTTRSLDASAGTFVQTGGAVSIRGGTLSLKPAFVPLYTDQGQSGFTNAYLVSGALNSPGSTLELAAGASAAFPGGPGNKVNLLIGANGGSGTLKVDASVASATPANHGNLFVGVGALFTNNTFRAGDGTLNLTNGGQVAFYNSATLGAYGGTGRATVSGSTSKLTTDYLYIGSRNFVTSSNPPAARKSDGTLTVSNGGKVNATGPASIGYVGGTGRATISGAGSALTAASLYVGQSRAATISGYEGSGTLSVASGGLASGSLISIGEDGGIGRADVEGTGSRLNGFELYVGRYRSNGGSDYTSGALNVTGGGSASGQSTVIGAKGATGTATVSGAGSTLSATTLRVGSSRFDTARSFAGNGTLTLENGGQSVTRTETIIGNGGGIGRAIVRGSTTGGVPSVLTAQMLYVGESNYGQPNTASEGDLTLSEGAQATASELLYVGHSGGIGRVVVGSGSTLTATGNFEVGTSYASTPDGSNGTVSVVDGGTLKTLNPVVTIGARSGVGTVTVSSTSSALATWNNAGTATFGTNGYFTDDASIGTGTLNVGPGGLVTLGGALTIAGSNLSTVGKQGGTLNLSGGTLVVPGLVLGTGTASNGRFNFTGGTLKASATLDLNRPFNVGNATIDTNGFAVAVSAVMSNAAGRTGGITKTGTGTLTLSAANTYTGATIVTNGTLAMTLPAYTNVLNNAGGLDVQGGRAMFDFGSGTSPKAQIAGLLASGYANGFTSGKIRSSTASGNQGLGYAVVGKTIVVAPAIYGDATLDAVVDFNDFLALQNHFGQANATFGEGDFDYSGNVDLNDFLVLQNNFNQHLPGTVAPATLTAAQAAAMTAFARDNATVPEPGVLALAVCGVGLLRRVRRPHSPA